MGMFGFYPPFILHFLPKEKKFSSLSEMDIKVEEVSQMNITKIISVKIKESQRRKEV